MKYFSICVKKILKMKMTTQNIKIEILQTCAEIQCSVALCVVVFTVITDLSVPEYCIWLFYCSASDRPTRKPNNPCPMKIMLQKYSHNSSIKPTNFELFNFRTKKKG